MALFTILQWAALILGAAALGGLTMAAMRFSGVPRPPDWLPMVHGGVAATGFVLLLYACLTTPVSRMAIFAACFFGIAALGGLFINVAFHRKGLALPIPLVLLHGLLAVIGFGLLVSIV